jgi:hypothetical protein
MDARIKSAHDSFSPGYVFRRICSLRRTTAHWAGTASAAAGAVAAGLAPGFVEASWICLSI